MDLYRLIFLESKAPFPVSCLGFFLFYTTRQRNFFFNKDIRRAKSQWNGANTYFLSILKTTIATQERKKNYLTTEKIPQIVRRPLHGEIHQALRQSAVRKVASESVRHHNLPSSSSFRRLRVLSILRSQHLLGPLGGRVPRAIGSGPELRLAVGVPAPVPVAARPSRATEVRAEARLPHGMVFVV